MWYSTSSKFCDFTALARGYGGFTP